MVRGKCFVHSTHTTAYCKDGTAYGAPVISTGCHYAVIGGRNIKPLSFPPSHVLFTFNRPSLILLLASSDCLYTFVPKSLLILSTLLFFLVIYSARRIFYYQQTQKNERPSECNSSVSSPALASLPWLLLLLKTPSLLRPQWPPPLSRPQPRPQLPCHPSTAASLPVRYSWPIPIQLES